MSNKFKLLPDTPNITETSFGAHKRIAGGLASMIENGTDGLTVAIEGEWGSGKSTVIHLLKEKLKENEDICFVEFDAWVNLGDPVRRAFLSRVISTLRKQPDKKSDSVWLQEKISNEMLPWVKNQKAAVDARDNGKETTWEIIQEEMVQKRDAKENKVSIGWLGFIFIFGILVAGFVQVLKLFLGDDILKGGLSVWQEAILGVSAFAYFGSIYYIKKDKNKFGALLELVGRFKQEDMTIGISSGNPTIIEFQSLFKIAVKSALCGMRNETNKSDKADHVDEDKKKRKLVIVLDNIDRVDQVASENIWSLIRTFVDTPEISSELWWAKRIWILVPVFQRTENENSTGENKSSKRTPNFNEKVFQASVFVPRPHSENIGLFLETKLEEALELPKEKIKPLAEIYKLFSGKAEDFGAGGDVPRKIIRFVNDVVTKCLIWENEDFTNSEEPTKNEPTKNELIEKELIEKHWNRNNNETSYILLNRLRVFAIYQLLSRESDFSDKLALNELLDDKELKLLLSNQIVKDNGNDICTKFAHNLLGAIHFNEPNLSKVEKQLVNRKKPYEFLWGKKLISSSTDWENLLVESSSKEVINQELSKIFKLSDNKKAMETNNIVLNISKDGYVQAYLNIMALSIYRSLTGRDYLYIIAEHIEKKILDDILHFEKKIKDETKIAKKNKWVKEESEKFYLIPPNGKKIEIFKNISPHYFGKDADSHSPDKKSPSNNEKDIHMMAEGLRKIFPDDSDNKNFIVKVIRNDTEWNKEISSIFKELTGGSWKNYGNVSEIITNDAKKYNFWIWRMPNIIILKRSNNKSGNENTIEDNCALIFAVARIRFMDIKYPIQEIASDFKKCFSVFIEDKLPDSNKEASSDEIANAVYESFKVASDTQLKILDSKNIFNDKEYINVVIELMKKSITGNPELISKMKEKILDYASNREDQTWLDDLKKNLGDIN